MAATGEDYRGMSDAELEHRGIIRLPFIVVPPGEDLPAEWLAAHPGAIRFPGAFRPHTDGAIQTLPFSLDAALDHVFADFNANDGVGISQPGNTSFHLHVPDPSQSVLQASYAPRAISQSLANRDDQPASAPSTLKVATSEDRSGGTSTLPPAGANPGAKAPATLRAPPHFDPDRIDPIPLHDDSGRPVFGPNGKVVMRPSGFDPHYFVQQGENDRINLTGMLTQPPDEFSLIEMTKIYSIYEDLSKFRQGAVWDAQRVGHKQNTEFVDYATIAIGLYAAAAGITETEILIAQDYYAKRNSIFAKNTEFDEVYHSLPHKNVQNTLIGMKLYNKHMIKNN